MKFIKHLLASLTLIFGIMGYGLGQDTTLAVTAIGNVGIGTSTPSTKLEINGGALIRTTDFTGNAGGSSGGLEIRGASGTFGPSLGLDNGTQQWNIVSWSDNALRFVKSSGSTFTPFSIYNNSFANALVIGQNGVGVNEDNPSEMLDVDGNIAVSGTVDGVDVSELAARESSYRTFSGLNRGSVTVTTAWTQLNTTSGAHTFTKKSADSKIEVYVNSRFAGGSFNGANGVRFAPRVDGQQADFVTTGSIRSTNTTEFLSMIGIFENLAAGSHTVSIYAQTAPSGTSTGVLADPGGWRGTILIKETW